MGGPEEDVALDELGLSGDEPGEVPDGDIDRPRLEVDLGQPEPGFHVVRGGGDRLRQLRLGLMNVAVLEMRQRELVVRGRQPRLALQDLLELLHGACGVPAGQEDAPLEEVAVQVLGILREHRLERRVGVVELPLDQRDLGQPAPGREGGRRLGRDLREDPFRLVDPPTEEIEVRETHPRGRARGRQLRRGPELPLGLCHVRRPHVEGRQRQMGLDRRRLLGDGLLEEPFRRGHVPLVQVEVGEGDVEPGLALEAGSRRFEPSDRGLHLLGRPGGPGQEQERLEVLGFPLEDERGFLPGVIRPIPEEVDASQLQTDREVAGIPLLHGEEVPERLPQLAHLEVGEAELPDGLEVRGVDPEDVLILDDGFPELLLAEVALGPGEVARLPDLRPPGVPEPAPAAAGREEAHQEHEEPRAPTTQPEGHQDATGLSARRSVIGPTVP